MPAEGGNEVRWRADFENRGESDVRNELYNHHMNDEERRQFGFRWLREKERARETLALKAVWYGRWTFWAAVAAVAVGVIGVAVSLTH